LIVKSFDAMLKKIESASPGDSFIVSGEEYYQSNRLLNAFRNRGTGLSMEPVRLVPDDLNETSLSAVFSEGSLFSSGKYVIIGDVDKITKSQKKELEKTVAGSFDHILFCRTAGRRPSNSFITKLEKEGTGFTCWEPFPGQMWKWAERLASEEQVSLTRDGSQAAEAIASGKLERLAEVIGRVALFYGTGTSVDASGVYAAVRGVEETTAFQFCREVFTGSKGAAMQSLSLLLGSGEEPVKLLALLYSQWKQVAGARELLRSGVSAQVAAKRLGVPQFRWRSVEELAGKSVSYATSTVLRIFAAADLSLKTGSDPLVSIASVVLSLTSTGK
jgi:DNA polymerase III delta subunit